MLLAAGDLCPCGSGVEHAQCCGPYLAGAATAPDARALMRSRYTAFVIGQEDYLLRTWHVSTRPPALDLGTDPPQWTGLQILDHAEDGDQGRVEFIASYIHAGARQQLHELSRFVRERGQWYYVDGRFPRQQATARAPGRNDPCPCGSGRKYKKCCLGAGVA